MRVVIQRVSRAQVRVGGRSIASIEGGLMLLVAVERGDAEEDLAWCADKIVGMRIFADGDGKMSRSVIQAGGKILAVSQFTLVGNLRRGRRPSFEGAAPPGPAEELYDRFLERLRELGVNVSSGVFGAMMEVELINDGPVTLLLDSGERGRRERRSAPQGRGI